MGENQCAHCGHVVIGFEQQEFEHKHACDAVKDATFGSALRATAAKAADALDAKDKEIAEWKGVFENFRSLNAELRLWNADLQGHANVLAARIAEMEAALHAIERHDGLTLLGDGRYDEGAAHAFAEVVGIARTALGMEAK